MDISLDLQSTISNCVEVESYPSGAFSTVYGFMRHAEIEAVNWEAAGQADRWNYLKMRIHYITKENHLEAKQATRAVLYLYNEIITSCGNFGHKFRANEFDPFKYLLCRIDITAGQTFGLDLNLLHQGSAVALLFRLYPFSCPFNEKDFIQDTTVKKIIRYLRWGAFDLLPLAKDAALSAFEDGDIFKAKLRIIHEEYILGYYRKITTYQDETHPLLHISHFKEKRLRRSGSRDFL